MPTPEDPPPPSAEPHPLKAAPRTDSPEPNSSSSKENPRTAGKFSVNARPREFQPETDIGTELVNEIAAARSGTRRCWLPETSLFEMEIAKPRENVEFEPQDYECQHAAAARDLGQNMRLMDRRETRMRRSYERAVEIPTSSALAPTTENFQTNPRISANNPQP